jgi:uncharacterized protein (TIGR02453 family)
MLEKKIMDFLWQLKENNTKEWFESQKKVYQEAKQNFKKFIGILILKIAEFDATVSYLKPKDCVFRIHRDTRFSKDKTPYKTNFGAYIVKNGKKSGNAGYYFHIEPESSFIAGGLHCPEPAALKEIRSEIYRNPHDFVAQIEDKAFKLTFDELWGERLNNLPRGFDKNFEYSELLKLKEYVAFKKIDDNEIFEPQFLDKIVDYFKVTSGFNLYLNKILEK